MIVQILAPTNQPAKHWAFIQTWLVRCKLCRLYPPEPISTCFWTSELGRNWKPYQERPQCRSQRDCVIYEMFYIRDLTLIINTRSITLINMVSWKVTYFLVTWHILPPYAQECSNAKTNLHICLKITSDDVDAYNNWFRKFNLLFHVKE